MTGSGVTKRMWRWTQVAACLASLALATGCGGKSKNDTTTPTPGDGQTAGDGTRPEDVEPIGGGGSGSGNTGGGVATGGGGDDGDDGGGDDGGGDDGGDDTPAPPAKIEPPGLDKSPEEIRTIVNAALSDGRTAMKQNRPDDAIAAARKALAADETSVPAMVVLAHAYYAKGFYDKAEAILDIAVKRPDGPSNPTLHFLFGLVYDKTDRAPEALLAYEKALEVKPNYASALLNVGAKYIARGRFDDAVRVYEKLTGDLNDKRPSSWSNLGAAYRGRSADLNSDKARRNQLLKKAEAAYKRATTLDKNFGDAYYNLGLLYLDADPFPAPDGTDMDMLARLDRAKTYFREYRGMPNADFDLVDEQVAVADKLYEREEKKREKRKKAEEKRRKAEERRKQREAESGGDS